MQSFDNLQELYSFLEENALSLTDHQIADIFKDIKDLKFEENIIEDTKKARLEQMLFDHNWIYGRDALFSDKDGESYDIYDFIEPNEYNYLIQRLNYTNNPFLQNHYAKILWFSPKSEFKYGFKLVDSNLGLFNYMKKR